MCSSDLAYGIFYQKPEKDYFLRNYAYTDLLYLKATHYIANYQRVSRDYTFRLEAFYKKYDELVKTYSRAGAIDSFSNGGFGDAKGIELFWRDRKTFKNVDYWISYSYLDTFVRQRRHHVGDHGRVVLQPAVQPVRQRLCQIGRAHV